MAPRPSSSVSDSSLSVLSTEDAAIYADVIIPRHLARAFTYLVPSGLRHRVQVGSVVLVPFGPGRLRGLVVAIAKHPPATLRTNGHATGRFREIVALSDGPFNGVLDPRLLELSRLVSERYLAPWGQCLRLVQPGKPQPTVRLALTDVGRKEAGSRTLSPAVKEIVARLAAAPHGLSASYLGRKIRGSSRAETSMRRVVTALKRRGWIREEEDDDSHGKTPATTDERTPLPAPPKARADLQLPDGAYPKELVPVVAALGAGRHAAFLVEARPAARLEGLLSIVGAALASRRRVLIIVPEIVRASAVSLRMQALYGDRVALFHSSLSPSARWEAWHRIRAGMIDVVVGTRSAVFAPLEAIGLIAVEDEEDSALKEQEEPRYHARDVAWLRARHDNAVLLLGSAHPSLETWASDTIERVRLRAGADALPSIRIVDLRQLPFRTLLSQAMLEELEPAVKARAGVIVYQNRRGFAPSLFCRDCGAAPRCPRCSVALTFYRSVRRLGCHYCGSAVPVPQACPVCLGTELAPAGSGTERIEEELRCLFPHARIARLDRDTARTGVRAEALRRQAAGGDLDILIGTQMLFQGTPLPPVGLVAIPHADAGLHLPDFRSAERTYQLLTRAVSLARSAESGGRVVLQTHLPDHHAIAALGCGDPAMFYGQELALRKALDYPPFTSLISLSVSGGDPARVKAAAEEWGGLLRRSVGGEVMVLGPIPSAVPKLRGRHRWHLLVKSADVEAARRAVKVTLEPLEGRSKTRNVKFEVDVDPVEML